MKFSHQLKFNSVADWKDHYVHYANLKKIIYEIARLEQAQRGPEREHDHEAGVAEPLLQRAASGAVAEPALQVLNMAVVIMAMFDLPCTHDPCSGCSQVLQAPDANSTNNFVV